jgi:hypothetical protein
MSIRTHRLTTGIVTAGALALVAACAQPGTPVSPTAQAGSTAAVLRQAEIGLFEICKEYVGAVGPTVTFNVTVDLNNDGSIDSTPQIQLGDGQCQEVLPSIVLGGHTITVTEVVPAGYTASYVKTTAASGGTTVAAPVASNTTSGTVGDQGILVVFTNTADLPPPPPPGNQGCTPGYWKQAHHFDSWPAAYTPTTLFSAVFENAFPGMTLDEVLGQGGGGLKALGRHTVAALLNAASSGVEYPITTAQVISGFNAVFPGGDYETLHLRWAAFNEAGCPLN